MGRTITISSIEDEDQSITQELLDEAEKLFANLAARMLTAQSPTLAPSSLVPLNKCDQEEKRSLAPR